MRNLTTKIFKVILICLLLSFTLPMMSLSAEQDVRYKTVTIDGLDVFYREAGNPDNPTILLLHGFPTSSRL